MLYHTILVNQTQFRRTSDFHRFRRPMKIGSSAELGLVNETSTVLGVRMYMK